MSDNSGTNNSENEDNSQDPSSGEQTEGSAVSGAVAGGNPLDSNGSDQQIAKLQEEVQQIQDRYLRALADLENFKKRSLKERSEMLKYQGEQLVGDLLTVADNLELAIQYKDADPNQLKSGLEMIYKSLCDVFSKWDIRAETAVGKSFDPTKHSAISKVPAHDVDPGQVVSELKKVYFYKDKMLRVGEVVVAVEPSSQGG